MNSSTARHTMNNNSVDIVILGGGIAGYAAAMASENRNVLLIEKSSSLGGATTQSNVGTLCGLYFQTEQPTLVPHFFCRRFVGEIFIHDNQAKLLSLANNLHVISYEWSNLQKMMAKHLASKNITISFNTAVTAVTTSGGAIKSITIEENGIKKTISCRRLIDCTGIGSAAQILGHQMLQADVYQSAAQVLRLKGISNSNEYSLNMALKRTMIKSAAENNFPASYLGLSVVPGSLRNNVVDLKLPLSEPINDKSDQDVRLKNEIELYLPKVLLAIKEIESLASSELEVVFPSPGIRIQQRPVGESVLSESDVVTCKKDERGIAVGTWPIEEWDYKGKVTMEYPQDDSGYFIPATCLSSPQFTNLFFAGKGISADSKAIASARVTGTCLQTGYAAGLLAGCETKEDQKNVIEKINNGIRSRS